MILSATSSRLSESMADFSRSSGSCSRRYSSLKSSHGIFGPVIFFFGLGSMPRQQLRFQRLFLFLRVVLIVGANGDANLLLGIRSKYRI